MSNPDSNKSIVPIDRIVAFIDILGFKDLVKRAIEDKDTPISRVYDALQNISAHAILVNQGPFWFGDITPFAQATAFSDCIVISDINRDHKDINCDVEVGQVLSRIALLAGFLLRNGILCRGAVVTGMTVHEDRVLFGNGLIEAYEIEKQVAIYPRVVVRDDLVERAQRATSLLVPKLKCDSDGLWFIDIFGQLQRFEGDGLGLLGSGSPIPDIDAFHSVRKFIILSLDKYQSDLRKRIKYCWLANRFNEAAKEYAPGEILSIEF